MPLNSSHTAGQSGHVSDHNLIDTAIAGKIDLPVSPTDGYVLAYSTAQGKWVAVQATGESVAGAAINNSGTATTLTASATVDVTSTTLAISPNGTRELWVAGSFEFAPTGTPAAGAIVAITIQEVSNGVDTPLAFSGTAPVTLAGASVMVIVPAARVGVIARTRTFKLQVSGSAASVVGTVLNSAQYPSIMRGEWK